MSNKYEIYAITAFGLEAVVARELKNLGITDYTVENGRVVFNGGLEEVYKANLWLRTAGRVHIKIAEFKAVTFEELYDKTREINWGSILPEDAFFHITGKSVKSTLFSISDCQAMVKKAIVDKMKEKYDTDWFEEDGPRYKMQISMLKDIATITLDTSGEPLHKRGYRDLSGTAPLKETMAAALIQLSFWKKDRVLIDPFCGTGTIPIEAAMIARNIAPGLKRRFDFEDWTNFDRKLFNRLKQEAQDSINRDGELHILGSDLDDDAVRSARRHAARAGVKEDIHFQRLDEADISSSQKYGHLICNPPYGERAESDEGIFRLYRLMGDTFKKLDTWSYYIFAPDGLFEEPFGRKSDKKRKLFNGRILCNYYQYFGPKPPRARKD